MVRVAICYWGMTRSTKLVHHAHKNQIFNIFKNNKIDYDVYIHTWKTDKNMIWGVDWNSTRNILNDYNGSNIYHLHKKFMHLLCKSKRFIKRKKYNIF